MPDNKDNKIWRIIDIIKWAVPFLEERKIESPRYHIEMILCKVLNTTRINLYTNHEKPLSQDELTNIRVLVKRILTFEPLQYIIGNVNFLGLELSVSQDCLIPRPETEEFVSNIITDYSKLDNKISILDIGTGSGCIALALASKLPQSNVSGIDIDKNALDIAIHNAQINNLNNVKFELLDISKDIPTTKFDLIVSNPPYIPLDEWKELDKNVREYEPRHALTDENDGLTFYRLFSEILPKLLFPNGEFFFEIGWNHKYSLENIFSPEKYHIEFLKDFAGLYRVIHGTVIP